MNFVGELAVSGVGLAWPWGGLSGLLVRASPPESKQRRTAVGNRFCAAVVSKSRRSRASSLIDAFLRATCCFLPPPCQLNVQEYASFFIVI